MMLVPAPALRNKGTNRAAVVSLVAAGTALSPAWAARWVRKPCGAAPGGVPSGADIVTKWGRLVDPTAGSPLPEYPRPQMVRSVDGWANLNGVWEWEQTTGVNGTASEPPPFGRTLSRSILVPFPSESCLSGIGGGSHPYQWYRRKFSGAAGFAGSQAVLHFGAVDWHATVYLNGRLLGGHKGGYDGFSFVLSPGAVATGENELVVFVYDPSEHGAQPFGKQRAASIAAPGTDGEKYTPTSGIWQTVWLERVPAIFIADLTISANLTEVTVLVSLDSAARATGDFTVAASVEEAPGREVARTRVEPARPGRPVSLIMTIPAPQLWSPDSPFLYNLTVSINGTAVADTVRGYFGMRTVALGSTESGTRSLLLNGAPFFASGWLDQSWWPDGQYTAPTDEALAFDVEALKDFGMNMVRLHQKINPDRWYFHADRLGVVVMQDMVQHFNYHTDVSGETSNMRVDTQQFATEWSAAIRSRGNHPCIIQWDIFNEGEFEPSRWNCTAASCPILELTRALDPSRLVDFNSGGPGNNLKIGDVNDIHSYPNPATARGAATALRYGMIGEYGGIGWAAPGHEWLPGKCQWRSAGNYNTSARGAAVLLAELALIAAGKAAGNISAVVYTQITDIELECDGIFTYDRISHYNVVDTAKIRAANLKLTAAVEN